MSVEVSTSPSFKAAAPKPLFSVQIAGGPAAAATHRWAISPDGQRFLINVTPEGTAPAPMTVVLNWYRSILPQSR
jgi:hypothetical protein